MEERKKGLAIVLNILQEFLFRTSSNRVEKELGNMPSVFPLVLSVSSFDGRKLLVIMIIIAVTLTVESQIGTIADFIPEQLASNQGIAAFIGIWAIFITTQYYILAFVKHNNKYSRARTPFLHLIHKIVTAAQFLLAGIIALVILQVLVVHEYNSVMLYIALSISYGLWIVTLGLLAKALFSWYRVKKNLMVLLFALSMVFYVINGVFGLYGQLEELTKRNLVIELRDVAIFPESPSPVLAVYQIASSIAYVLTWIATVMLLRPYIEKLGKLKFWSIMGATMVYYLIQFPLFTLGYFTPSENSNAMTRYPYFLTFCHIFRNNIWSCFSFGSKNSKNWYCHQELHDYCCLWFSSLLYCRLCSRFTSRLSTIWTCLRVLHRIILLPNIQWSVFFCSFSFTGHDIAPINQKICNGAIKTIG
jgi:hypothetical protein